MQTELLIDDEKDEFLDMLFGIPTYSPTYSAEELQIECNKHQTNMMCNNEYASTYWKNIFYKELGGITMTLKTGKSKKIISSNVSELIKSKPSKPRAKGIRTLAKKKGISSKLAKRRQAIAIAMSKANEKKK